MLDVWIIEEIRRREQELERLREEQRPRVEIPLYEDRPLENEDRERDKDPGSVVIVIQIV